MRVDGPARSEIAGSMVDRPGRVFYGNTILVQDGSVFAPAALPDETKIRRERPRVSGSTRPLAEELTDAMRPQPRHAFVHDLLVRHASARHGWALAGFFVFLFAAFNLSLGDTDTLIRSMRTGTLSANDTSHAPAVAARDAGRAILTAEVRDPPHTGWIDGGHAIFASPAAMRFPTGLSARGTRSVSGPVRADIPYGFLPRGPPRLWI